MEIKESIGAWIGTAEKFLRDLPWRITAKSKALQRIVKKCFDKKQQANDRETIILLHDEAEIIKEFFEKYGTVDGLHEFYRQKGCKRRRFFGAKRKSDDYESAVLGYTAAKLLNPPRVDEDGREFWKKDNWWVQIVAERARNIQTKI